jgi:hypothetical protein
MAESGRNAAFTFATVVYDADDCLQGWDLNSAINDITYECNGYTKHLIGTKVATFRAALALSATDTTKVTALVPGTTGAFEAHPAGDTLNYIEIEVARAQVNSANISAPMNGVIAVDVEFALDDIDYGASTT